MGEARVELTQHRRPLRQGVHLRSARRIDTAGDEILELREH